MSVIFGVISKRGVLSYEQVNTISNTIDKSHHKDAIIWQDHNVALGSCALFTSDIQHIEQQLLENEFYVICLSGQLHNRSSLLQLLSKDAPLNDQATDVKIIAETYKRWGDKCVDHIEGEFVFAIWNKRNRILTIFSDHLGYRPIFYYDDADSFIFCSEIKGVEAAMPGTKRFREESLLEYHFRNSDPTYTYNMDIYALCGGNVLTVKDGQTKIQKYWSLQARGKYRFTKDSEWADCLRDLLFRAVEKRLCTDMPTGVTLSGGLDSTTITCILAELLKKKNLPLYSFSSVLPDGHKGIELDEKHYIELITKRFSNIIPTFTSAANDNPFDDLIDAFRTEEGFPNVFFYMDRAIVKLAEEKGISTLFSGMGGDYWVSWPGGTVVYELMNKFRLGEGFSLLRSFSKTEKDSILKSFVKKYISHTRLYAQFQDKKNKGVINWQRETALKNGLVEKYSHRTEFDYQASHLLLMSKLVNKGRISRINSLIVNRNARYGMASANPMFDKDVYEFLADVPLAQFVKDGKKRSLIRLATKGIIPEAIRARNDKLPYAPGYHTRILESANFMQEITTTPQYQFVFDQYFNKKTITDNFYNITPVAGFTKSNNIVALRIAQAMICIAIIKELKEKFNYEC